MDAFEDFVREKINNEIKENRIAGPFEKPPFSDFRISPLGILHKKPLIN